MFGKLGYDNLPTLAMWKLNSYASLTAGQRTTASRGFDDLLAWHRRTQLDDVALLIGLCFEAVGFERGQQARCRRGKSDADAGLGAEVRRFFGGNEWEAGRGQRE